MTILFPSGTLNPRAVEPDFEAQLQAAQEAGLGSQLLDFDALTQGDISRALRMVRSCDEVQVLVYRGWMLRAEVYELLYNALHERSWRLLNGPAAYALCHELPRWYGLLEGRTPRSVWLPTPKCFDSEHVLEAAESFSSDAVVVKDYVKSRKHEWSTACFIGDATDAAQVERVTQTFLRRQGEILVGGLVLRQFVPLRSLGSDQKSGAPIVNEWRLFWLDHALTASAPHGEEAGESPAPQVLAELQELAGRIGSRFFSMDVAQLESGEWIVIELGDGSVSGLPPQMDAREFYASLMLR